jgi:hypothetical protein
MELRKHPVEKCKFAKAINPFAAEFLHLYLFYCCKN